MTTVNLERQNDLAFERSSLLHSVYSQSVAKDQLTLSVIVALCFVLSMIRLIWRDRVTFEQHSVYYQSTGKDQLTFSASRVLCYKEPRPFVANPHRRTCPLAVPGPCPCRNTRVLWMSPLETNLTMNSHACHPWVLDSQM